MNDKIKQKLQVLPTSSGVYLMLDKNNKIIYIGKAIILKNRVKQYFQESKKPYKVEIMVQNIEDFDYIVTKTEQDALLLESTLIKKYKPYYNILLKDDKKRPYIKVTIKQDFPCFSYTRKLNFDGSKYFGPFMNLKASEIINILREVYKVRTCKPNLSAYKKACLYWYIDCCTAPCVKKVSKEDYNIQVENAINFLKGKDKNVKNILLTKMNKAKDELNYEQAIIYRDQINLLDKIGERTIFDTGKNLDIDFFAYANDNDHTIVSVMCLRNGKIAGITNYNLIDVTFDKGELFTNFLQQYYSENAYLPQEVVLPLECENANFSILLNFLKNIYNYYVEINFAKRGIKKELFETIQLNAKEQLQKNKDKIKRKEEMTIGAVKELEKILNVPSCNRMECYDISNISGTDKVASEVVFINGEKAPKEYRKFKIKTVKGSDDFASMKETLLRRFQRAINKDNNFKWLPDLIIIDGGKGQLSAARDAIAECGLLGKVNLISLAKKQEEIFTLFSEDSIKLPKDNYALKLLQRIRDEAHRFAITFHRKIRSDKFLKK